MMKLAFLLQCHKNPDQVNMLIKTLTHPDIDFYVHVDKKSDISTSIDTSSGNVFLIPDAYRVDVKWATYSQVEAAISLIKYASSKNNYNFYWQISGQCFPLVDSATIVNFLASQKGSNFIELFKSKWNGAGIQTTYDKTNDIYFPDWMFKQDFLHRIIRRGWVEITGGYGKTYSIFKKHNPCGIKYYYGSCWWCLSGDFIQYCLKYIFDNTDYCESYKHTSCPDESFFQTLLMNSTYAETQKDYLHYIDWSEGKSSPKTLTCDDLDKMFLSGKLMARKIDSEYDRNIIPEIKKRIGMTEKR